MSCYNLEEAIGKVDRCNVTTIDKREIVLL